MHLNPMILAADLSSLKDHGVGNALSSWGGKMKADAGRILTEGTWDSVLDTVENAADVFMLFKGVGSLAKKTAPPVLSYLGSLPRRTTQGRRLTVGVKLRRLLLQDTQGYPGVRYSPVGALLDRWFPNLKLQMHHTWIQQAWTSIGSRFEKFPGNRGARIGLQRLGNSGLNLLPIPGAWNNFLGRHPTITSGVAALAYGTVVIEALYIVNKTHQLFELLTEDDDQ
jgi:hypothetical protein